MKESCSYALARRQLGGFSTCPNRHTKFAYTSNMDAIGDLEMVEYDAVSREFVNDLFGVDGT